MPAPHPKSLRDRIVEAYNDGEGSYRELGLRFKVGEASVNRWVSLDRKCGDTTPKPMGGARWPRRITPEGEDFLRDVLMREPSLSLPIMSARYQETFDVIVSSRLIGMTLKRLGFTKKKGSGDPLHRNVLMWSVDDSSG